MARRKKVVRKRGGNLKKKLKKGVKRVGKFAKDYAPLVGLTLMNAGVGYAAANAAGRLAHAYDKRQRLAEIRRAQRRDIEQSMQGLRALATHMPPNFTNRAQGNRHFLRRRG